jgi:exodeoxyribonuclease-3
MLKLITWNVNSVRLRLERLCAVLERHRPDLVCLQELKCTEEAFPFLPLSALGYQAEVFGQKGYNGVALLSRKRLSAVQRGFPGDPCPGEARLIAASLGELRIASVYVVNGQSLLSPKYQVKLEWLDALLRWLERDHSPAHPLLLCGDFNVAPEDRDVWDAELWRGQLLCSEPERWRIQALLRWGLRDLHRLHSQEEGVYTFWDYSPRSFARNRGLRLDLALGTEPVAQRCRSVLVDREERRPQPDRKPSDHAPVVLVLED